MINVTLQGVDVLIVIIGPNFELDRLAQPNDYVHMEILEALRLGKAIVPVLVDDAVMPAPGHLPPELESFAYRNAAPLRADPDFDTDADGSSVICERVCIPRLRMTRSRRSSPLRPDRG